jgi:hypothetical protein
MDPVPQGSFIPKQSLAAASRGSGVGLLFFLALIIFVMSIVAAGAAYGTARFLNSQIAKKDVQLQRDEGAFNASTIQELVRMDVRIAQARGLVQKHISPSALLFFLSTITLERVQFTSFNFSLTAGGGAALSLNGVADSFSGVALQSDQFNTSKVLKDVVFSGIAVDETGKITFSVSATVDPDLISYSKNVQQSAGATQ